MQGMDGMAPYGMALDMGSSEVVTTVIALWKIGTTAAVLRSLTASVRACPRRAAARSSCGHRRVGAGCNSRPTALVPVSTLRAQRATMPVSFHLLTILHVAIACATVSEFDEESDTNTIQIVAGAATRSAQGGGPGRRAGSLATYHPCCWLRSWVRVGPSPRRHRSSLYERDVSSPCFCGTSRPSRVSRTWALMISDSSST